MMPARWICAGWQGPSGWGSQQALRRRRIWWVRWCGVCLGWAASACKKLASPRKMCDSPCPGRCTEMAMPLHQSVRLGSYLLKQKVLGRKKFPLLVELEPLFACNLACAGCGKIAHPASVLKQRMPVEQAVGAVVQSGAPMVSIAGGEPLMHKEIDEIVRRLLARNKIVFLCTNAMLLPKHLHRFSPHRNFAWMVHIDGLRERHDASVCKTGVFDQAVAAIKQAKA